MDIICSNCSSKFRIPDEKIPAGRVTTLPCPKCKTRISLDPAKKTARTAAAGSAGTYDAADKPFDFMEEEGLTAMLCEQNPIARKTIESALSLMDYQITIAESARDALKRMRYHVYDLIVVDENFDTKNPDANGVLIYLERLQMATRRNLRPQYYRHGVVLPRLQRSPQSNRKNLNLDQGEPVGTKPKSRLAGNLNQTTKHENTKNK